ncbi:MAG: ATP-binding protein [Patescibacteria group bacterium]
MTESMDATQADRRDVGSHDSLAIIDEFDAEILEINKLLLLQNDSTNDLTGNDLADKLKRLDVGLKQWKDNLPAAAKEYLDHDAKRFIDTVMGCLEMTDFRFLLELRERMMKNWEICRLVMQDVAIRGIDGEDKISERSKEMDKDRNLERLIEVLQYLMLGYNKSIIGLSMVEVDEELTENKNIRIAFPHGVIANLINNFITNSADSSVHPPHHQGTLKLEFGVGGAELILSFFDNCDGMDGETMEKIYEKGFSKGKKGHGHGLGLAYADRRVEGGGGKLFLASREKKIIDGEISFGETKYSPENMSDEEKAGIELDELLHEHSTGFQIRIPLSAS